MKDFSAILSRPHRAEVVDRLVRYAKIETTSDRHNQNIPSTQSQWDLARLLVEELKGFGVGDVSIDDHCYVIARIPASPGLGKKPAIGFMAHVDTASDVSGANVQPRVIEHYDGKALQLARHGVLDPEAFPELKEYAGDTIIVTDGATLLGADDKAGVAIVMTAINAVLKDPSIKHGPLYAIFTPDEETGKGMDLFPMAKLDAVACYTFDGGTGGEIESECFTAYEAKPDLHGKGFAPRLRPRRHGQRGQHGRLVSSRCCRAARAPRPPTAGTAISTPTRYTAGSRRPRSMSCSGTISDEGMERRQASISAFAAAVEAQFPGGTVGVDHQEAVPEHEEEAGRSPKVLELLYEAARKAGAEPYSKPIRGGTDGARLTEMGIPTPNIFAGMHNFHSRFEWASAPR